jgi:antirestriction protein ArdC
LPCDIPNHASYVASWLEALRRDKREIFRAAADAQKIADYLLQFHPDFAAQNSTPDESDRAEDGAVELQAA